ncbi:MAG: hypothetical protein JJU31_06830 [Wenzhouxiangella sp.]|nr:hypothetical protein [Wenzhouxiangella sp.]
MTSMRLLVLFAVLTPMALAGCAGAPLKEGGSAAAGGGLVELEAGSLLDGRTAALDNLLYSRIKLGADEIVSYDASYSLRSTVLADGLLGDYQATALPAELGRQSLSQSLRFQLPSALGAPVQLDFRNLQALSWSANGESRSESQAAQLKWNPDYLALDLRWSPPRQMLLSGQPLDCYLQANLRLPALVEMVGGDGALDLSGRNCLVHSPARGVSQLEARSQQLVWRWGEGLDSGLRLQRVLSQWGQVGLATIEPAYELGLSQQFARSDWRMGLDMAWRQAEKPDELADDLPAGSRWAMNLMLSRQLGLVALTARWLHANDPLWFVPLATPVERERVSLLLDFSQWLVEKLPQVEASMSASWEHVEDARGVDDKQVRWNVELSW